MGQYPDNIKLKAEKQVKLWLELLSISRQKVELVQGCSLDLDVDKLNALLDQHQERIEAINGLGREIEEETKNLEGVGGKKVDLAANPDYQQAMAKIRKTALLIKENDSITQSQVQKLLQQTGGKLQSFKKNKKAQQAYLQEDVYTEGWFIDQKK
jgi:hypothetical protein